MGTTLGSLNGFPVEKYMGPTSLGSIGEYGSTTFSRYYAPVLHNSLQYNMDSAEKVFAHVCKYYDIGGDKWIYFDSSNGELIRTYDYKAQPGHMYRVPESIFMAAGTNPQEIRRAAREYFGFGRPVGAVKPKETPKTKEEPKTTDPTGYTPETIVNYYLNKARIYAKN